MEQASQVTRKITQPLDQHEQAFQDERKITSPHIKKQ